MTFGEKLRELRDGAGLTQTGLANASGVPIGTIRDYEQVRREPLLFTAFRLAKAIGVSVEAFAACARNGSEGTASRARGRPARPALDPSATKRPSGRLRKAPS